MSSSRDASSKKVNPMEQYWKELKEHGSIFGVTSFPPETRVARVDLEKPDPQLINLSDRAKVVVDEYNKKNGTNYKFTKIEQAIARILGREAHIRFEAEDPDLGTKTFENRASFCWFYTIGKRYN